MLLGRSFFAHVTPLRSRLGVAFIIWEGLVSIGGRSRENFVNNCFALLFIYIRESLCSPMLKYGSRTHVTRFCESTLIHIQGGQNLGDLLL